MIEKILGISWYDHVTDEEVLAKANVPSMYAILMNRRLLWLGHVDIWMMAVYLKTFFIS